MNRATFRNLWLLVSLMLVGAAWFMFQKATEAARQVQQAENTVRQLIVEKNSQQVLSTKLDELDRLTLDERNATRLDILRHLDLEATGYQFDIQSRQGLQVGGVIMYQRPFSLRAVLPYAQALGLADKLHNNPKVVLNEYILSRVTRSDPIYGDAVRIEIKGSLYGLEK